MLLINDLRYLSALVFMVFSLPGYANSVIFIENCEQLEEIGTVGPLDGSYQQIANIDCSTIETFKPIGQPTTGPFTGHYNGNGYTISNLFINHAGINENMGLFGYIAQARLENIGLINSNVLYYNTMNVSDYAGTLIGQAYLSTIHNSYAKDSRVDNYFGHATGGLIGFSVENIITDSYVEDIRVVSQAIVGGLIGEDQYSSLANCSASGSVFADVYVGGGLMGQATFTHIEKCHATADVLTNTMSAGGLIGSVKYNIHVQQSYASGEVISGEKVGGLIGDLLSGHIENSYATGHVTGTTQVGGLIGNIAQSAEIINTYATGFITQTGAPIFIGGLIGKDALLPASTIIASYWDINTSGQISSQGGQARTTDQMQLLDYTQDTYVDWDQNIWNLEQGFYPTLK